MRIVTISKRQGDYRTIYIPSRREKEVLQRLLPGIRTKAQEYCQPSLVHGFLPGHSPVTNAEMHIGWRYTLSFDLANFFDHVSPEALARADYRPGPYQKLLMPDRRARQGLSTSPFLANIAGSALDATILSALENAGIHAIYTRYADDLAFSYNEPRVTSMLKLLIPSLCANAGFPINPTKTRLHSAANGRRVICGVAVGDYGIFPTRASKRKLRAALHQNHTRQATGLREWMHLKAPRQRYLPQKPSSPSQPTCRHVLLSIRPTPSPRQYAFDESLSG